MNKPDLSRDMSGPALAMLLGSLLGKVSLECDCPKCTAANSAQADATGDTSRVTVDGPAKGILAELKRHAELRREAQRHVEAKIAGFLKAEMKQLQIELVHIEHGEMTSAFDQFALQARIDSMRSILKLLTPPAKKASDTSAKEAATA